MTQRVLIVDDEANLRRMLQAVLEEEGFTVETAEHGDGALAAARRAPPDVVLLDLVLGPAESGLDVLEALRAVHPDMAVVMMSGKATLADAVRATRLGAFQFLEKPLSPESVITTARAAADLAQARAENRALRARLEAEYPMVGSSRALATVRSLIARVAPTPSRVLVTGASGTGKELVARAVHAQSPRAGRAFVSVNCAAVPRELIESELFGHEKGAFTGATERRAGKFELAHRGTLLLDEVGELEPAAQAKLLRVLETSSVERVGGSAPVAVDVRVIAATNKELAREVRGGRFREDLYFRLNVFPMHVPPLTDRLEDLPELLEHHAARAAARCNRPARRFGAAVIERLARHHWPGNVRELANLVERLTILGDGDVRLEEVEEHLVQRASDNVQRNQGTPLPVARWTLHEPLSDTLAAYEKQLIEHALASGGSVAAAARLLQTDRANLYRRMKRLGVRPNDTDVSE